MLTDEDNMLDKATVAVLVGRSKPLRLGTAKDPIGETITSNEESIRLDVFEGHIKPEDAMRELDTLGCSQLLAERRRYEARVTELEKHIEANAH